MLIKRNYGIYLEVKVIDSTKKKKMMKNYKLTIKKKIIVCWLVIPLIINLP